MRKSASIICILFSYCFGYSQSLRPGFDKNEYIALMKVSAQFGDSNYAAKIPPPQGFRFVYRSPVVGLDNRWDLWQTDKGIPIISIRGTTQKEISWLENFYAAMVAAKGDLQLSATEKFTYQLTENPKAAVHIGWLIGTGFLSKDILPKIDSCYKAGVRNMYIMGHSQGGAIAYLLTAYLYQLQKTNRLPADLRFKTYCSAAPKPGNLYFAYEYEAMTQEGWSYNVVNAEDWVPQTPFTVQTVSDFAEVNPFTDASSFIGKNKWPKRWALNYAYGKLTKPGKKAKKNYQKYLGNFVSKSIKKALPGFVAPAYFNSNEYVRAGNIIALVPKPDYYQQFPVDKTKVFRNHLHAAYLYLTDQLDMDALSNLQPNGAWELSKINGQNSAELYSDKRPLLQFELSQNRFSGNTGCNSFNGSFQVSGNKLSFSQSMAMTKMMCPGNGEQVFLNALKSINNYQFDGNKLILLSGTEAVMELIKK